MGTPAPCRNGSEVDSPFLESPQDDPVYVVGNKFVVYGRDGSLSVRTCMGVRQVDRSGNPNRIVYWDDGSYWEDSAPSKDRHAPAAPRPLQENELWITEAITQFQQMLAGQRTDFRLQLGGYGDFVGKFVSNTTSQFTAEGLYTLRLSFEGKDAVEGRVKFKPTEEYPDIISRTMGETPKHYDHKLVKVEVLDCNLASRGKRWRGVFYIPA